MRSTRGWFAVAIGALAALGGCEGAGPAEQAAAEPPTVLRQETAEEVAARLERELEMARERILARADSAAHLLSGVRALTREERADLRRDVNAAQIAVARTLGIRPGDEAQIQHLVQQGRLVELEDSTGYWVLRDLDYSVPYVTPGTRAMLMELGRRFHARLDTLGLPRYRFQVTSVLRTPASQAELRSSNANASRGVSAHEFGTTVDVAHTRFAAPAESGLAESVLSFPGTIEPMRYVEGVVMEAVAREHAVALQAELGRVLREMRAEDILRVMMERRQAVYHMTVSRRLPAARVAE